MCSSYQSQSFALIKVLLPALGDYPENTRPRISHSYQQTLHWQTPTAVEVIYNEVNYNNSFIWKADPVMADGQNLYCAFEEWWLRFGHSRTTSLPEYATDIDRGEPDS
jgi:hypothetical protein